MKIQGMGPDQGIERSKSEYRNQRCTRRRRLEREVRAHLTKEGATVVETNIHTATDSCLLGDGAQVLMRTRRLPRSKKNEYVTACVALDRKGPSPVSLCRTNHARGRDAATM